MVHTLCGCLSTGVLRQWCYCGTDSLWLSTGVLEQWCYYGADLSGCLSADVLR